MEYLGYLCWFACDDWGPCLFLPVVESTVLAKNNAEKLALDGPELLPQKILVRQLHRGKYHGAEDEIQHVTEDQK
ncbi:hypothetical protein COCON_G00226140 [Conger conger]|uniref:Uncharacterized protein n=1 Tax=Conger conger TaxID=82655 RepID=A0A9Q1CXE9_CONCO|nr:hypothetical protein COCON_G00226140 [Conger conger]